jgi:hypothetical protein
LTLKVPSQGDRFIDADVSGANDLAGNVLVFVGVAVNDGKLRLLAGIGKQPGQWCSEVTACAASANQ